ncbi:MAG: hypothetical protein HY725_14010 [Candidatus Rokubacteria bacterium]|nr:hypothetical protein [Candidatus Rokubacteria bacterium]
MRPPETLDYNGTSMREYRYLVDRDGRIFHDGTEIVDPFVLRFFLRSMKTTPDGRYLVLCQDEHNWFEPHDTPFVVQRLRLTVDEGHLRGVELCFAGDYREPLDPASLQAEGGHLFCRVRHGAFRARFGRVAMQQIAPFLTEGEGGPALLFGAVRYQIRDLTPVPA